MAQFSVPVVAIKGLEPIPAADRIELTEIVGEAHRDGCVPGLLKLLAPPEPEPLRRAALGALASYKDDQIGAEVVKLLPQLTGDLRETAESLLTSRRQLLCCYENRR